jgi:hypothetical protein
MSDLDDWLSSGSRPEATVDICLVGDLSNRYSALADDLLAASQDPNRSLDDPRPLQIAEEMEGLRERMEKATRTFTLRAMPPQDYLDLQIAHPPRKDDEVDVRLGYNRSTFHRALVEASTVAPELTAEQWDALLDKVSSRQWDELWVTAQQVNRSEVNPPKSLGISELMPTSTAKSKKRRSSGSRSRGSAAGSPAPGTSTPKDA